jgi:hypothetical protein
MSALRLRQVVLSILAIVVVCGLAGYASGIFTDEVHREDSCPICRADRLSGRQYGFAYNRIEENAFTRWYRTNIEPEHGLDAAHPHHFTQSACTTVTSAWRREPEYQCVSTAPIFLLRPDIELAAVQQIPDKATQIRFLASLNDPNEEASKRRVIALMRWYYMERGQPWAVWWAHHAAEFGIGSPEPRPHRR